MEKTIDFDNLRTGLVIGLTKDNTLVFGQVGTSDNVSYMELLGLAETAVDLVKVYRDQSIPSLLNHLKQFFLEVRGLQMLQEAGNAVES